MPEETKPKRIRRSPAENNLKEILADLETAKATNRDLLAAVEKLTKECERAKSDKDTWYKCYQEKNEELEQMHSLIDALSGAPAREITLDTYGNKRNLTAMTRLAAWLASRK